MLAQVELRAQKEHLEAEVTALMRQEETLKSVAAQWRAAIEDGKGELATLENQIEARKKHLQEVLEIETTIFPQLSALLELAKTQIQKE